MNTNEYLSALETFIVNLHSIPQVDHEAMTEIMTELCGILRIGSVEIVVYENESAEHLGLSEATSVYSFGGSCSGKCINKRVATIDEKIAVYYVFLMDGESEWSDVKKNRIDILMTLLSTFNGKTRLIELTHHLTYFDSELNMFNFRQFMKCARILCRQNRIGQFAAVWFNLRKFSVVNQHIGRDNGTLVMKKYIGLIEDLIDDENEVVARIGGDNFITLMKSYKLQSILNILSGTGVVYDEKLNERISIAATAGVYDIQNSDSVILPTDIMDRASMAFHLAKNSAKTDVVYFDDVLLARSKRNSDISANFPKALEEREFLVYYQPKVAINGRNVAGAEALCRWMHNGQLVSPGEFIPVLEQGRDICKRDFYMLDAVCKDIRRWLDSGKNVVRISVNLSRRHLSDMDLLKHIVEIVDRNNVPHQYIEIELTETTTDVEFKDLKRTIGGLQKTGISTSVDDFGVGYSSLNLIKEIPWDVLKLDKSLLPTDEDENKVQKAVMFKYIVAMAQEMGLECISEGVETKEQVQLLAENNCNLAQGFYFDRPLPVAEFEKRLEKGYVYNK